MATVTSTIHAAMNAFGDGMLARANIISAKVQVWAGYLGGDSAAKESIQLTDVTPATQEWGLESQNAAGTRNTRPPLNGLIWVLKAGKNKTVPSSGPTRISNCSPRWRLLRVDPTMASTAGCELASYPLDQGANQEAAGPRIDFAIACKKDLRSS